MFEILGYIVDKLANLLSWLSEQQVRAAYRRIRAINGLIHTSHATMLKYSLKHEHYLNKLQNERAVIEAWLATEPKEL